MMKLFYQNFRKRFKNRIFLLLLFGFVPFAYAGAQNVVTGTVTDQNNDPLIGVSVSVKNTVQGTMTDLEGRYSITVKDRDAVLVFSYIGYSKQEHQASQSVIDVILAEDTKSLEEVVVIGYGTQKKVNLTGAVGYIDGKQLENRSVPTMAQALQGKVANLNISTPNGAPGTSYNYNVRGYTGLNSSGSPLVVIDGIQGGDLNSINMNDVESISVLKDAASAAIYGSSAPFGVIIVTTKKGRAGKPVITYNNNFGFSQPTRLPHYVNSLDFANAFNEVGANSNYGSKLFSDETIQRIKDYQAGILKEETIKNPSSDNWYSWDTGNANNDWYDIYFKKASFSQQHNIGVSGATETSNYYIGLGYNQQDGLYNYANDGTKRYNIRANLSSDLTKWLNFSFRSAFSRMNTDVPAIYGNVSGGNSYSYDYFHQLGRTYPTVPLKNPDGYYSEGGGVLLFTEGGRRKETTDNAMLTGEFVAHLLPGWDATANYTYSGSYIENSNHRKTFYLVKPSGEKTPRGGTSPNYIGRNMYKYQHHTINAFTSYEKTLGGHTFKALVGFTQELYDNLSMSGSNDYLYSDEIPMLSMTYGTSRSVSDAASQLAIRGGFGRINYNYEEKYLLELNGRYDGTSRFLKAVRNKFYPGMSAGWVVSKESFWEPVENAVNIFKLRGSYGSIGEQSFTDNYYPFYPSLGNNSPTSTNWIFSGGRESSFWQPGLVDPNLTWQTVTTLDFGFDIAALRNRLNFTFDWYRRYKKDLAVQGAALPGFLGTTAPLVNNGEMETKGFDITIGWKDKIGEVSYGANLVLSDYIGKVLKYDNNPNKLISSTYYEGMTMGEIWGYETVGLFKDQAEIDGTDQSYLNANWYPGDVHYKDLDDNNKINIGDNTVDNPGDRKIIGNSTPRYSFGLTLNAEWRGIDAAVFMQGVGKRDLMFASNSNYFWGFGGDEWQSSYFTVHTDRWTTENPDGYYPRAYFNTDKNRQAQTRYLQNAAYLRLKNIQIGYTIPKTLTDKISFQKARIFVNVENIATFTKLINIVDPEIVNGDAKVYPLQKTWAFGLNITF
ncbi:MAG: TonB-dependent receptor [Dysgonamonadaceae bacterium]|jgi:TonB-linked SusC/RagA family outer membrane protein|nr:TonB-dependent receptor [Dysgonamonadaceae bacterium]